MFFIGLAGSFMPYLLLFGALFVLTMGVNLRGDAIEEIAEITEKTIGYQNSDNQSAQYSTEDNSCYFFHVSAKAIPDYKVTHTAFLKVNDFLVPKPEGSNFIVYDHRKYSFDIYHTFFGLSPPVMIS